MGASSRAIEAGRAVIRLAFDDRTAKGMEAVDARLRKISGTFTKFGAGAVAASAPVVGVLGAVVARASSLGDQLEKAGVKMTRMLDSAARGSASSLPVGEREC